MSRTRLMPSLSLGAFVLAAWSGWIVGDCAAAEGRTVPTSRNAPAVAVRPAAEVAANPPAAISVSAANNADGWYRRYLGDYGAPNPGGPVNWYPVNPPYRHVPCFGAPSASFYPGGRFGRWDANGNWGNWGGEGYPGYNGYTGW